MRKLSVFNFVTLNGFYKGAAGDISWHKHSEEGGKLSEENLKSGNILLFGRVTYEMRANFWPLLMAYESFLVVAEGMNNADKIVFSKTLQKTSGKILGLLKTILLMNEICWARICKKVLII